jgi:serine/threonine protein kinase
MTEPRQCPRCGGELSAGISEGLCPECLFRQALEVPGTAPYGEDARQSPAPAYKPPSPVELAPHFPQFEVLRLLGHGGMGAVYLARQPELDRLVAVKILPPEVARDSGFKERFAREARSLARLNHPNIVTIFDFGTTDGLYYFSMEYVDGKNVRELLQEGEINPSESLKIIAQVCDALQYAHDEGFVHRDIKPENILLDSKGRVKIADFGLARLVGLTPTYLTLTGSSEVMGTLYYMAPEQLKRSGAVDHRADLYSLGVVFYEMLTGELPVGRFAPPSQRAKVDDRLDAIVLRALAREPEYRHQDAAQIKREIDSAFASEPASPARPLSAVRSVFPCVRFTIPDISWLGGSVQGEIYRDTRDESYLVLEYQIVNWLGMFSEPQLLRIPLAEITTISCYPATRSGLSRKLGVEGKTEIVLKVYNPDILAGLPAGKQGRGRLKVQRGDRDAAIELVESILRTPVSMPLQRNLVPAQQAPHDTELAFNHEQIRSDLLKPAIFLVLTSILALASTVALVLLLIRELHNDEDAVAKGIGIVATALLPLACAVLIMVGALRMIVGRNKYLLCVTAALLAVLPWSPAWLIGLPAGVRALVVLGRPEVIAAFLGKRKGANVDASDSQALPGSAAGKIKSWFHSVAGYFLTTAPKRAETRSSREGEKNED